jgi:hypothetical protein
MAVDVTATTAAFSLGVPHALFELHLPQPFRMPEPISAYNLSYPYAVASNGQRFLIATDAATGAASLDQPITIVVNWPSTLDK